MAPLARTTDLIVPSISACPHLFTALEAVCSTEEVAAQISKVLRRSVVEADNKQGIVNDVEASLVIFVL